MTKEPENIEVGVACADGSAGTMKMPVQSPSKILAYLIHHCGLHLPDSLVANFWNHLDDIGDEWALGTKRFRQACAQQVWPVGIYGDEACIGLINAPTNQIYGIALSLPLFRPKATRIAKYLLFSIESDRVLSMQATLYPVFRYITDNLNELAEDGLNGRRFLVSELRGDQAWFRNIFQHASWWRKKEVCFRCQACTNQNHLNYLHYDDWISTRRTTGEFLFEELPQEMCGLYTIWKDVVLR